MKRRAVPWLAAAVILIGACARGPSGTVSLAPTEGTAAKAIGATPARSTPAKTPTALAKDARGTPTGVAGGAATEWYTSSASNAKYYYCTPDHVDIAAANRRVYPSEQALLADWSGKRTKWPQSKC